MEDKLREKIEEAIGEYASTVMRDNSTWVFATAPALRLRDQILNLLPEPPADKVEAVAKWLAMRFIYGRDSQGLALNFLGLDADEKEDARKDAREILHLLPEPSPFYLNSDGQWKIHQPEYEPVELETLDRLVNEALGMCSERSPRWRAVVLKLEELLAAVQHNQYKGQLYRRKENNV